MRCNECWQDVEPVDGVCPKCKCVVLLAALRSDVPITKPRNADADAAEQAARSKRAKSIARMVGVGLACAALYWCGTSIFGENDPSRQAIKTIVSGSVVSPSTLKFQRVEVLAANGDWVAGYAEFDSQNTFGAMLRTRMCVVGRRELNVIHWDKRWGAEEDCSWPVPASHVEYLKRMNGWPGYEPKE